MGLALYPIVETIYFLMTKGAEMAATKFKAEVPGVGRKKVSGTDEESRTIQVRIPEGLHERLAEAARLLALDLSSLVRVILVEHVSEYLERGRKAKGGDG